MEQLICRKNYFENCTIQFRHKHEMENIKDIQENYLVGVQRNILGWFVEKAYIELNVPCYIHIIDNENHSCCASVTQESIEKLINKKNIKKCFCENWIGKNSIEKLIPVPIGLESHSISTLYNYIDKNNVVEFENKPLKISSTFHHMLLPGMRQSGFKSQRPDAKKILENNKLVTFIHRMNRINYFKHYNNYKFTISPTGNGIDCHRTWEAILFQTIPIVKTGPLDFLYKYHDLPVAIVNDWNEITTEKLVNWSKTIGPKLANFRKLTIDKFIYKLHG